MEELFSAAGIPRKFSLEGFHLLKPRLQEGGPLRPFAIEAGIPYRTAQCWLRWYQCFGFAALVPVKKRIDTGAYRTVPIKIKVAIEGLARQRPALPIAALHRQVQRLGGFDNARTAMHLAHRSPQHRSWPR
jgi:putative transposase